MHNDYFLLTSFNIFNIYQFENNEVLLRDNSNENHLSVIKDVNFSEDFIVTTAHNCIKIWNYNKILLKTFNHSSVLTSFITNSALYVVDSEFLHKIQIKELNF